MGGRCRFCGIQLQHVVVDLGVQPLANSYLSAADLNKTEPFYPLTVFVCGNCFLVQLNAVVSAQDIFSHYAYFSSYSETWLTHARAYAEIVAARFGLGPGSHVIEVGSNDGYLLQYFQPMGIDVLGVDPAENVAAEATARGVPTLVRFFGTDAARDLAATGKRADLLIGNNVLAHVPELNDFVEGIRILLKDEGVATLEFPHLLRLMEENQFDTIYHEHFSYFTLFVIERVFDAHDLVVFDVDELPTHGGSLRIYACRKERAPGSPTSRVAALRAREYATGLGTLGAYRAFAQRVMAVKRGLLTFLMRAKEVGETVAGYGAPAKGNTLLNYCGIRGDLLEFTVDRSPHKQGRYLPGTHIPIYPPERIWETKPDYLLILPWNLTAEVMKQMAGIRDWGGRFVIPIPEVKILS